LCEQLAIHFNAEWCPEFAREYLSTHGMNYQFEDLLTIAKGQIDLEERTSAKFANKKYQHPSSLYLLTPICTL